MIKREDISPTLLSDVKNYLNITWDDQATDDKVRGLIASATAYIDKKAGGEMDYDDDGEARTLMMDYVRYARDEALDVFETNYLSRIIALQNDMKIQRMTEDVESPI